MNTPARASLPVIKRLPKYYRYLCSLQADGINSISSRELAAQMGTTASQVRQDFNCIGDVNGRQGIGYSVENLLSNAALYSPEGAEIRVTAAGRGAQVVLTVENTGARIPAEALPHLFEAFYRAEPSRSRATGGSGLGLYLVRMIVERHGGTCRIENSADGVRFTALIPRLSTENT